MFSVLVNDLAINYTCSYCVCLNFVQTKDYTCVYNAYCM